MKDYLEVNSVGYTLDPDDPAALADLLIQLADNPAAAREMGARAKVYAARDFDKDILADKMLDALLEAAESHAY